MPEETPEQIMARLARYADSLRQSPGEPIDDASRRAISRAAAGSGSLPPRSAVQSPARRGTTATAAPAKPAYPWPPAAAPRSDGAAPAYPWPPAGAPPAAPAYASPEPFPPASVAAPAQWTPAADRFVLSTPLFRDIRTTVFGQLVAVAGCAGAIIAFVLLGATAASVLVLAVLAVGVVAIAGHRSLAWWWTLGVLAGALLGRFS